MCRIKKLAEVHYLVLQAQLSCYETSQELEEKQYWYNHKPAIWKKSLQGRYWARTLFKAHKLIAEINYSDILDSTLSTKRGRVKVLAIKSKGTIQHAYFDKHSRFSRLKYQEIVGLIQLLTDNGLLSKTERNGQYANFIDLRKHAAIIWVLLNNEDIKSLIDYLRHKAYLDYKASEIV